MYLCILCSLVLFLEPTWAFVLHQQQAAPPSLQLQSSSTTQQLDELLQSLSDPVVKPLSGPGFCNQLYHVTAASNDHNECCYVAKIFSDMAKERRPTTEFALDIMASEDGIGPKILQCSQHGLLMEFLEGSMLTEHEFRTDALLRLPIARQLKRLHSLPSDEPNVLWYSLQVMMKECTSPLLKEAFEYQKDLISQQEQPLVECCGHGDMKPSNVFVSVDDENSQHPTIRFIDFELSGRHYRGFDVAKLFRTDEPIEEEHFAQFCRYYDENDAASVQLEAEVLMPLTWLEAAIFFDYAERNDGNTDWKELLDSRMASYEKSLSRQEEYASQRRRNTKLL